ncbi:MAG: MTH1187 family thiamine-binding protein [Anaerolineales bacterium]|nr:MTH1187 family thiamine-binding protein [Anaerolineales bacterium]MCX7754033.1 MTH1187 family thiamine-binding protein [Anaerolineales bacterium]MDW8276761.1 MTH1187 family thiamine-binding protein [Anaerolineales bacterium]
MNVIVEFSIVPIGVGVSLSEYVAECERILAQSGLNYELHANGTNVEGEWETVFGVIRQCHETLHAKGAPRLYTVIKLGTRTDKPQRMADKVASVKARLKGHSESE